MKMRRAAACLALVLVVFSTGAAAADLADYVGKPLADVRVELGGQLFDEPAVLELIQTRVGDTLQLQQVRETIDHLIGLGRFEDIQVFAEPSPARPGAVTLRWVLAPVQRVGKVTFGGDLRLDQSALRDLVDERVGTRASTTRVPEVVDTLRAYYADRGYRTAAINTRIVPGEVPELVTLAVDVNAGRRTRIGRVTVTGTPPPRVADVLARIDADSGDPFDAPALQARVDRYEDTLRADGHYEASVTLQSTFADDNATADIAINVDPGPRVRVVFAGDALPENRRDTLVPISQERSVDLDLLEDASRNIEGYLRQQGYRNADVSYTREQGGQEMVLTFNVRRGPLSTLGSAQLAGNRGLADTELTPLLKLQPGEPFSDARVATVASAMTELYRVHGFARAAVRPEISQRPQGSTLDVTYRITEGAQTIVGDVSIAGNQFLPAAAVRAVLTLTAGRPFYRPQLEADRAAIDRLYRNEGFQSVRVAPETTLADDDRRLDVRWVIREGGRTIVDHVLVTGNDRTSSEVIRREIVLQPGKPLGEDAISESQRLLSALGLFRRVRIIALPHGGSGRQDVLIEVEEAPSTSISEGGGIEAQRRLRRAPDGQAEPVFEVAPRGFFEVTRRNLWGKNRSVSLFTRVSFRPRDPAIDSLDPTDEGGYGFNEFRVLGTMREPRPFDSPGEAQFTAFIEQASRTSFNFSRRGGRAEYVRRIDGGLTVSGRYAFDYTKLFDEQIKPDERLLVDRLFPQVRLSTLTGSVLRDSRNDVLDPERGTVTGLDVSVAPRFLFSEVGFVKMFGQGMVYRRLPGARRFVLAAAARVGLAVGFARVVEQVDENGVPIIGPGGETLTAVVTDLPASERFFAGGDSTVRGFVLDQLGDEGTLNSQGFPTGGNAMAVFNAELRAPYWKGLGVVTFLDVGNVFSRVSDISLFELRPAAGFGVRYKSPLGPLRVDLGFNLNRRTLSGGGRERGSVLHISLGQAF
jgi:outer membrane protein insertion porin family